MKTSTPDFVCLNVIFVTQKDIPFTHILLPINKKMFSITLFILSICSELRSNILWGSAKEEKNPE